MYSKEFEGLLDLSCEHSMDIEQESSIFDSRLYSQALLEAEHLNPRRDSSIDWNQFCGAIGVNVNDYPFGDNQHNHNHNGNSVVNFAVNDGYDQKMNDNNDDNDVGMENGPMENESMENGSMENEEAKLEIGFEPKLELIRHQTLSSKRETAGVVYGALNCVHRHGEYADLRKLCELGHYEGTITRNNYYPNKPILLYSVYKPSKFRGIMNLFATFRGIDLPIPLKISMMVTSIQKALDLKPKMKSIKISLSNIRNDNDIHRIFEGLKRRQEVQEEENEEENGQENEEENVKVNDIFFCRI